MKTNKQPMTAKQPKTSLSFKLNKNPKGTPWFGIKGERYLKINGIKNATDLLNMIHGTIHALNAVEQAECSFNFYSRGPFEWSLVFKKCKENIGLAVHEIDTEVETSEETGNKRYLINETPVFVWKGIMHEFVEAVELLLEQNPFHPNKMFKSL